MPMVLVSASILAADAGRLAEEARRAEEACADWLHVDVMDGSFVPRITFGPSTVAAMERATGLFLDVHLMVREPEKHIDSFAAAGADAITIHAETARDAVAALRKIKSLGRKAGLALNPGTPLSAVSEAALGEADLILVMSVEPGEGGQKFLVSSLEKIRAIRAKVGTGKPVSVDGGLNAETAAAAADAGASVLVAGTAVFGAKEMRKAVAELKAACAHAQEAQKTGGSACAA